MYLLSDPAIILREQLLESLVVSYAYCAADATFVLVCDYWNKAPGSDRAFVRLLFGGVGRFRRELGQHGALQQFTTHYNARLAPGVPVIQAVRADMGLKPMSVNIWFGPSFGGVSFSFESVTGHVRNARARARGAEYDYFDFETGVSIDFYAPFDGE